MNTAAFTLAWHRTLPWDRIRGLFNGFGYVVMLTVVLKPADANGFAFLDQQRPGAVAAHGESRPARWSVAPGVDPWLQRAAVVVVSGRRGRSPFRLELALAGLRARRLFQRRDGDGRLFLPQRFARGGGFPGAHPDPAG